MATIKKFEDIEAWQQARTLCNEIGVLLNSGVFLKDYRLIDQINGSSGSVMDNIAEGFERDGRKEFIQFLSIAKASSGEVKSQLYRALDRAYINKDKFNELYSLADKIGKMIAGFMKYLIDTEHKGLKFQEPEIAYNQSETRNYKPETN